MKQSQFEAICAERMEQVDKVSVECFEDGTLVGDLPTDGLVETFTEDRYRCPDCDKLHTDEEAAMNCCLPFYAVEDAMDYLYGGER